MYRVFIQVYRSRSHWDIILCSMPSVIYHISVTIDVRLNYNEIFNENKIKPLEPTFFMQLHKLHITSHKCDLFASCCVSVIGSEKIGRQSSYFSTEIVSHTLTSLWGIYSKEKRTVLHASTHFPSLKHNWLSVIQIARERLKRWSIF